MKVAERIYRVLLRAYPREFRDEYGGEMALLFRDRHGEGRVRLWLQVLGDLLFHAPREHWSMVRQDVRHALRSWRRAPAAPAIAFTALTIGMGLNIAIFSVVQAVLLRPLSVPDPDRLMLLRETSSTRGIDASAVSLPNYLSWRSQASAFDLAAFSGQTLIWTGPEYPERVEALAPTASFAAVVGAPLRTGRWFSPDEERRGQHRVVVLSERLWRTRFAAAPDVIGRQLTLNTFPYTVIGVASAAFTIPSDPDVWVPQVIDQADERRGNRYLTVLGRLKPGVTRERAEAEMTVLGERLAREFPDSNAGYSVGIVPYADSAVPREIRTALVVLLAAAAMVLLIACANVANVLLSRSTARAREMAIRAALGAGGARIARQLLTESLLLSTIGAILGLFVCTIAIAFARRALTGTVPRIDAAGIDPAVLAFAGGLALVTGIGFGLAPLWHLRRSRNTTLLLASGRGDRTPARNRMRTALVFAQVSLTTLLLVGAGLLVQSLANLQRVPLGITTESVVTAKLSLTRARLQSGAAISDFLSRLTSDLQGVPGIHAAGISSAIPLSPGAHTMMQVGAEDGALVTSEWRLVDSGYFRTLQIPLLRGRLFGTEDGAQSPRVFVISQQTAQALYGTDDPVGRRLRLENGSTGDVVGVVADVRMKQLGEPPERVIYFPPSQFGFFPLFNLAVRSSAASDAVAAVIRERLKAHDPQLAAYEVQSMQHWVDRSAALMRIRTWLVAIMGGIALLLGLIGVYGVLSYLVGQRAHEFGIRIALGAPPLALPLGVVRDALRYTIGGVVAGLSAAALVGDRIRGLLFEIDAHDPATFIGVAVMVLLVAVAAAYAPARRASRVDPLVVLRAE